VLFYSLYLPYAQAATGRFPDPDELAGFFGIFWAAVTAAAFLVSMLLTNRLLGGSAPRRWCWCCRSCTRGPSVSFS
jgi:hypothetical protein